MEINNTVAAARISALRAALKDKGIDAIVVLDPINVRYLSELSFEDGVNSRLVASILDKIIVKRESTKEEIHLDIYLKMGQIYETVYQPQKSSSKDNPLKHITRYQVPNTSVLPYVEYFL